SPLRDRGSRWNRGRAPRGTAARDCGHAPRGGPRVAHRAQAPGGESCGTRAPPERVGAGVEHLLVPHAAAAPVPRVVVKADLLPAVSAVSLVALLGLPLGWLWSRLAPPQQSVRGPNGSLTPLLVESYHAFDAIAIFS